MFHKSATFIYILCWELFAAWCQYIERFDNQLGQIQNGWIVYATHLQSKSGFGRQGSWIGFEGDGQLLNICCIVIENTVVE